MMCGSSRTRRPRVTETSQDSHSRLRAAARSVNDAESSRSWCTQMTAPMTSPPDRRAKPSHGTNTELSDCGAVTIHRIVVPLEPGTWSIRDDRLTLADLDRLLQNG